MIKMVASETSTCHHGRRPRHKDNSVANVLHPPLEPGGAPCTALRHLCKVAPLSYQPVQWVPREEIRILFHPYLLRTVKS